MNGRYKALLRMDGMGWVDGRTRRQSRGRFAILPPMVHDRISVLVLFKMRSCVFKSFFHFFGFLAKQSKPASQPAAFVGQPF